MKKFNSIEQFRHIVYGVQLRATYNGRDEYDNPIYLPREEVVLPTLDFIGTVKLHGVNTGITEESPDKDFSFQSHRTEISLKNDCEGFVRFISGKDQAELRNYFKQIRTSLPEDLQDHTITVYGEFCGGNIQSGVALKQLPKMFVIFAAAVYNSDEDAIWLESDQLPKHPDFYRISDFKTYKITINFNEDLAPTVSELERLTLEVEQTCPVSEQLGSIGKGEGIVWRCISEGYQDRRFMFKTKGREFNPAKVDKTSVSIEPEKLESIDKFISYAVTPARLEQGLTVLKEMGLEFSTKNIVTYLNWVYGDILKEEYDVMEASSLNSKDIMKPVTNVARVWFLNKLKEF